MITFIVSLFILILGYLFYSRLAEKVFGADKNRKTPAYEINDGVDYTPIKRWKLFFIELLNIAGTGPIFGAIMGAIYGPMAVVWVVLGCVLGGAIHDYFAGMISVREKGSSINMIIEKYLGKAYMYVISVIIIVILFFAGAVFCSNAAGLLNQLIPFKNGLYVWAGIAFLYCFVATVFPIDKIIGRIYPIFGAFIVIMGIGIIAGLVAGGYTFPEITSKTLVNASGGNAFPFLFVTIACGAVSGFHSTQLSISSRCLMNEKQGRPIFYGAMITEGVIALIWVMAGVTFFGGTKSLAEALTVSSQSEIVYNIAHSTLGKVGAFCAVIGVVVCPISSADTAFRSARLLVADLFKIDQKPIKNRLLLTVPFIVLAALLLKTDYSVLWRFFSWINQFMAMFVLYSITSYLYKNAKCKAYCLISYIPALFLTFVVSTYFFVGKEILGMGRTGYAYGVILAVPITALLTYSVIKKKKLQ